MRKELKALLERGEGDTLTYTISHHELKELLQEAEKRGLLVEIASDEPLVVRVEPAKKDSEGSKNALGG
ncbi:protein of unknown function (plasmid) [Thermococcus nautili]|uniref:hypothetical protein n=1 Tax=Thermococcus nautili TaxID=195522 RepID=UPI002554AA26|nr:hypothetical protein [Thermococcus nautili]CAI1494213.1 protein of unknown function [Thermococcus nautili]